MTELITAPLTLDVESVEISKTNNPEWEICMNLTNGQSLYHYTKYVDGIIDQLNMDIDTDEVVIKND